MPTELQVIKDLTTNLSKGDKDLVDSYEERNRLTSQMIGLQEKVLKGQEVSLKALERLNNLASLKLSTMKEVMAVNTGLTKQIGLLNQLLAVKTQDAEHLHKELALAKEGPFQ
jgi:CHASE3 domain sensor protein